MFGYVKTDFPNLYIKDDTLYKAMYCGLCKSIGKCCGNKCRLVLNYDLTFLSVLLHNVCNEDIRVEKQRCFVHWFRKKAMSNVTELSKRIAYLNVILAHYKILDDIIDNGKGKIKKLFINKGYKKAKKSEPILDDFVRIGYENLRKLEVDGCDSIDIVADCFSNIILNCVRELSRECFSESLGNLAYNLGKWIYLIDAIDDFDKDLEKKSYNVFSLNYKDVTSKKELIEKYNKNIIEIFSYIISELARLSQEINYSFNHDLTDNVLLKGLRLQTKKILENKDGK